MEERDGDVEALCGGFIVGRFGVCVFSSSLVYLL